MPRDKTVKIDLRISERDAKRLDDLMTMGDWNRSEALRFVLNFSYVMMDLIPAAILETFLDRIEASMATEPSIDE